MKDTETNEPLEPVEAEESAAEAKDIAEVTAQRDEYLASWQRSQADYQNLRRRLQTDIDAATARAKVPLLQDLLLVLDYLDMALQASCTTTEGKNLQAGVEMTKGQLVRALEREGVRQVVETGVFDAAVHQAVERVETDELPPNTIVSTMRKGYTQNGAVLRPAQVRVAAEVTQGHENEET